MTVELKDSVSSLKSEATIGQVSLLAACGIVFALPIHMCLNDVISFFHVPFLIKLSLHLQCLIRSKFSQC